MNWYCQFKTSQAPPVISDKEIDRIANYCIDYVWKKEKDMFRKNPEAKYSYHNVGLTIENDAHLYRILSEHGEEIEEKIQSRIKEILEERENRIFNQRKSKTSEDHLQNIKAMIRGKPWEKAKLELARLTAGWKMESREYVPDDKSIEEHFSILYNVLFYGSYVDLEEIRATSPFYDSSNHKILKRLNEIRVHRRETIDPNSLEGHSRMNESQIFYALFGGGKEVPPESIKVYRGTANPHAKIRPGDYVTPVRDYARYYAGGKHGVVISSVLPTQDLVISKIPLNFEAIELVYFPIYFQKEVEEKGINAFKKTPPMTFRQLWEEVNGIGSH